MGKRASDEMRIAPDGQIIGPRLLGIVSQPQVGALAIRGELQRYLIESMI